MRRLTSPLAPLLAGTLLASAPALAAPTASAPSVAEDAADDELPPPPVVLRHVPPRFSWEFAFSASYGMIPSFPASAPWAGFGLRGGWGRHYGPHRVGVGLGLSLEGPVTVQWTNQLEPQFLWDWISPKGFYLGLSAGPSLILAVDAGATLKPETAFDVGPMLAMRVGFSQPWSLLARRFFVVVEPKVRYVDGQVTVLGAIVIGQGRGY